MPSVVLARATALWLTAAFAFANPGVAAPAATSASGETTIAFGSCLQQWRPQPVWRSVAALAPGAFVFLGDNMYADKGKYLEQPDPERIATAYGDLAATTEFSAFRAVAAQSAMPLFATWDDHDYGANDGGADYPHRLASKGHFLDFFGLAQTASGDASRPGVYQSHRLRLAGLDVQLILLDTRSFRSPLRKDPADKACPKTHTVANTDPDATVLGEAQWRWLAGQLNQPADLRLIASSIQVIPEQHCFEKWANFPQERQRLFDLISTTGASGVVLLSGDRHHGEISVLPAAAVGYPLHEITASGLNAAMGKVGLLFGEQNRYRVGDTLFDDHFGTLALERRGDDTVIHLQLHTADGTLARQLQVPLASLSAGSR